MPISETTLTHSQSGPALEADDSFRPLLKVIGLGGGGCNAVERMMALQLKGIEFVAANTDAQALRANPAPTRVLLGPTVTRGFGAGGDPRLGRLAAEESKVELAAAMAGADMVFLTAGLGGGTGSGSIPIAAEIARAQGAVTIAVVTMPFSFEMGRRRKNAIESLERLREHTHTLIAIPNDRLLQTASRDLPLEMAFRLADDVLRQAVQGISELITEAGLINIDFAHIRRLILRGGGSLMAIGQGEGENKAQQALEQALHHPLLEEVHLGNAAGVIANFSGGPDLTLFEVHDALNELRRHTGEQTEIIFGATNDERLEGRLQVILLITGLGGQTLEETLAGFSAASAKAPARAEVSVAAPSPLPLSASPVNRDLPPFFRYRSQDPHP